MPNFMMVYKGEATDMADMSEEDANAVMAKWGEWMQNVGSALTDLGTPFGPSTSVVDDGSSGTAASLTRLLDHRSRRHECSAGTGRRPSLPQRCRRRLRGRYLRNDAGSRLGQPHQLTELVR